MVETILPLSTTKKFLKNIALSNSTLDRFSDHILNNFHKVELERAMFFKNFFVKDTDNLVSTFLNPIFVRTLEAVVYKTGETAKFSLSDQRKSLFSGKKQALLAFLICKK